MTLIVGRPAAQSCLESLLVAARKIGLDWSALLRSVADITGRGMAPLLQDFLASHAA